MSLRQLSNAPELQVARFGLVLSLLWEVAQFPLYTVWHESPVGTILFALAHCTLGDVLILVLCHGAVALMLGNRHWLDRHVLGGGALFTLLGETFTVFSERYAVYVRGAWDYTDAMPLVPPLGIGLTPFLQWLLVPPTVLWLVRLLRGGDLGRSPGNGAGASPGT